MSASVGFKSETNSQVTHYQKYKAEYEGFLSDLSKETLSSDEQPIFERAAIALKKLDSKSPDQEQLSLFLQDMLVLHTSHLERAAKEIDRYNIPPLFLKRVERLDRLSTCKDPKIFEAIYAFAVSYCVNVAETGSKKNSVVSAHTSHFLIHPERKAETCLFKPLNDERSQFPGVSNSAVAQRQLGAYLLSRMHGSVVDVPLSTLSYRDNQIGSLQIFRKSDGALSDLSPIDRLKLSTKEVQLAGIFRGRLYDGDAHLGNLLFKKRKGEVELTHIDLDYILPVFSRTQSFPQIKMGWRFWPQMDKPFEPEVVKYLQSIDIGEERERLEGLPVTLSTESLNLLEATTAAFQIGAKLGLTPGEVVDFLDSDFFKGNFDEALEAETPMRTFTEATMKFGLEQKMKSSVESHRRITELTEKVERTPTNSELMEEVVLQVSNFVFDGPASWRYAVKLTRESILLGVSGKDALAMIVHLQTYARSNPILMYAAIESLADSLEVAGKSKEATEVREWLKMNLT